MFLRSSVLVEMHITDNTMSEIFILEYIYFV